LNQSRPVTGRAADAWSQILWDEERKRYLLHTREDFGTEGGWREIRGQRTLSNENIEDFPGNWTVEAKWYLDREGKEERDRRQIYSLTSTLYHGMHIGLATVLQHPRNITEGGLDRLRIRSDPRPKSLRLMVGGVDTVRRHERDVVDAFLVVSRDGVNWDLESIYKDDVLIERGGDGDWDKDQIHPSPQIITLNHTHYIYYAGLNERHDCESTQKKSRIGLARLVLDRFAAMVVSEGRNEGLLITKPFKLPSLSLILNSEMHIPGSMIEVDLLRAGGEEVLDSCIFRNKDDMDSTTSISKTTAQCDFQVIGGGGGHKQPVVHLRFCLHGGARLFSFWFTDA